MTTQIYHVLSNLNHNGDIHLKGDVFESDFAFDELVAEKVLEVIDATTVAEAKDILTTRGEKVNEEVQAEEKKPENQWEAKKDPIPGEETASADQAPTPVFKKYTVLLDKGVSTPDGVLHAQGEVVELDSNRTQVQTALEKGFIEEVKDTAPALPEDAGANL